VLEQDIDAVDIGGVPCAMSTHAHHESTGAEVVARVDARRVDRRAGFEEVPCGTSIALLASRHEQCDSNQSNPQRRKGWPHNPRKQTWVRPDVISSQ